ncbi:sensor domain-containing protein [Streptomyces sp. 7-21]|uniref:sensor domain-containing protein n=1 Tax=Streptomyces sp. 7-21 TaxID=2802283 RepID=UPI001F1D676D|nr:sensor domain-containing protein [Streptomyces sp. 7-21]
MAETMTLSGTTAAVMTAGAGRAARRPGQFGREVGYLLAGLPLGTAAFTLGITGFTLGVSTLVIWIGFFVLAWALSVARYLARVEAAQVAYVTGRPLPPREPRTGSGPLALLRDAQAWRDLVHSVLAFPLRVVTFSLTVAWLAGGAGELLYGVWSWALPEGDVNGLFELITGNDSRFLDILFHTATGAVLLATAKPVIRGLVTTQAGLARVLLRSEPR